MGGDERHARKMKRYRSQLAHFKRLVKDAEKEYKAGHISKKKLEKISEKCNVKKNKVIQKMKKLKSKY
jgi:hypothetical protein